MITFRFTSTPAQCQPLSLRIVGKGGVPPYNLYLISTGSNGTHSAQVQFNAPTFTLPSLPWMAGSQFVAVLGDQNGLGSIGTTSPSPQFLVSIDDLYVLEARVSPLPLHHRIAQIAFHPLQYKYITSGGIQT